MQDALTEQIISQTDIEAVLVFIEALLADEPTDEMIGERVQITRREITKELKKLATKELIGATP